MSEHKPTAETSPSAVQAPAATTDIYAGLTPDEIRRDYPYRYWGARVMSDGTTVFRVFAPAATGVDLLCEHLHWQPQPMLRLQDGTWETTVKADLRWQEYKYLIRNHSGYLPQAYEMARIDPFSPRLALHHDGQSRTYNSIVPTPDSYPWTHKHAGHNSAPMSIYEMHLSTFFDANYREIAEKIAGHVGYLGFTHVQIMPPFQTPIHESWGYLTGCPYAVSERYGTLEDFKWMVNYLHENGLGVIVDVPLGFGIKDWDCGLASYDGTDLYHHQGPLGWNNQWQTRIYNKSIPYVRDYLCGVLTYLYHELGIDGVRIDAVSAQIFYDYDRGQWDWPRNDRDKVPQELWDLFNGIGGDMKLDKGYWISEAVDFEGLLFLRDLHLRLRHTAPALFTIAEESRRVFPRLACPVEDNGLGFTYAQNMGEMHRVRKYLTLPPKEKRIDVIEKLMTRAHPERFVNAMNTHDECANGKTRLITELKNHIQLIGLAALCWFRPGAPMLFMGDEFCEEGWFDIWHGLDWGKTGPGAQLHQQQMTSNIHDLNHLLRTEPALARQESYTLDRAGSNNESLYFSFVRWGSDCRFDRGGYEEHKDDIIFVRNESPCQGGRAAEVCVPLANAEYQVIYNSVDERYIGRQGYNEHDPYWTIGSGGQMLFLHLLPYQNLALRLKR